MCRGVCGGLARFARACSQRARRSRPINRKNRTDHPRYSFTHTDTLYVEPAQQTAVNGGGTMPRHLVAGAGFLGYAQAGDKNPFWGGVLDPKETPYPRCAIIVSMRADVLHQCNRTSTRVNAPRRSGKVTAYFNKTALLVLDSHSHARVEHAHSHSDSIPLGAAQLLVHALGLHT